MTAKKTVNLLVFLSLCILSLSVLGSPVQAKLFDVESTLELSGNPLRFDDVQPDEQTITSTITIRYDYGKFALPPGFLFKKLKTPTIIDLTVTSKPTWCIVSLADTQFSANISSFFQPGNVTFTTTVTVKIDDEAPAFEKGTITIQADAEKNKNILPSNASLEFTITPDFSPAIDATISDTTLSLEPGEKTMIAVQVENLANGPIVVSLNYSTDIKGNVTIDIPEQKTIDIGDKDFFLISLESLSPSKKVNDTITFYVSYVSSQDPSVSGEDIILRASLLLTSENEDVSFIDLAPYIIGIAAICIVLIIIFSIFVWRRKSTD